MKFEIFILCAALSVGFTASAQAPVDQQSRQKSGFIEAKADDDAELKEAIGEMREDFSHKVPEPLVAKSHFIRMNGPKAKSTKAKKSKAAKHFRVKKSKLAKRSKARGKNLRLAKRHAKKGRTIASVSKHKKKRTLAKRGHSLKTALR